MRELVPAMRVVPAEDGWMAVVPWVEDAAGAVGQLVAGPADDVMGAVAALHRLIRDIRWPWASWPPAPSVPRIWVPPDVLQEAPGLSDWAAPLGWEVAVLADNATG